MASTLLLTLCLGMLAVCLAAPTSNIRWCVKSDKELRKCNDLRQPCSSDKYSLSCVHKASTDDCFKAIADGLADAMTLDSGDMYRASLLPYNLKPIMAENYGTEQNADTCYYAVALVKKSTSFMFDDLKGKKTCHTGVGRTAGWYMPLGVLISQGKIKWGGPEEQSIEKAVSSFFSASCAPGAKEENMCKLCAGKKDKKCKQSDSEPHFGYAGACKCLKDGGGEVAFVKHIIPADCNNDDFELMCLDNTRRPLSEYAQCNWGRVPAHAVVAAKDEEKIRAIVEFLLQAKSKPGCILFGSSHGSDLMFKDSAKDLIDLPNKGDTFTYMGRELYNAYRSLHKVEIKESEKDKILWCTQTKEDKIKCDTWAVESDGAIECEEASSAEDCITKIMKGEAHAATLDGGYLHTAGACGLVPAMGEIYDAGECKKTGSVKGSYYAVAVARCNSDVTWKNLLGKKSCHTGLGRTAGWVIPCGLIHNETGICDMSTFFKESCAPGADADSNLCKLCVGDPSNALEGTKCSANNKELYYGYEGAFRCLVVGGGDVCFVKDTTVFDNANQEWMKDKKVEDFCLLCRDGTKKPVSEYESCHLAEVPAHAVACLPEKKKDVIKTLLDQQSKFGKNISPDQKFRMFASEGRKDQLFKDSTECLREIKTDNMHEFLGKDYTDAVSSLNKCSKSELLKVCTFHTCKITLKGRQSDL